MLFLIYERSCFWNEKEACRPPPLLPTALREQSRCSRGTARCGSLLRWPRKAYRPTPMPQRLCNRDIALTPSHRHHQPRRSPCPAPQSAPMSKGRVSVYILKSRGDGGYSQGSLQKAEQIKKITKMRRVHISVFSPGVESCFFFPFFLCRTTEFACPSRVCVPARVPQLFDPHLCERGDECGVYGDERLAQSLLGVSVFVPA